MVWHNPAMLRREAEGKSNVERVQLFHLVIEPLVGARTKTVSPAQTRSQMLNAEAF